MQQATLPEKVLQFGNGILLRGLPDYFIHEANAHGVFSGHVVVVKSTPGNVAEFEKQHCRYTICVRGTDHGSIISENIVCTAISRVLPAAQHWSTILGLAANQEMQVVISNTTEVGIQLTNESIFQNPPESFPGKLAAWLYERFGKLGNESKPVVIIPTELLPDNGRMLKEIIVKLADFNKLEKEFITWLDTHVMFCNSLVDRIVTPPSEKVKESLPAPDPIAIQTEPYKLWAVEGSDEVREILTFANEGLGMIIAPNIAHYRERKLRLLNGTGTMMASLGFVTGLNTTYECMMDASMGKYVEQAMLDEVEPTLPDSTRSDTRRFAAEVLERWRNPNIVHKLLSVTLQATAKMKMRNVPTLFRYAEKFRSTPDLLAKGFAAHMLFMKAMKQEGVEYFGNRRGEFYPIKDDKAGYFSDCWKKTEAHDDKSVKRLVSEISSNVGLWEKDLSQLPEFVERVSNHLVSLIKKTDQ